MKKYYWQEVNYKLSYSYLRYNKVPERLILDLVDYTSAKQLYNPSSLRVAITYQQLSDFVLERILSLYTTELTYQILFHQKISKSFYYKHKQQFENQRLSHILTVNSKIDWLVEPEFNLIEMQYRLFCWDPLLSKYIRNLKEEAIDLYMEDRLVLLDVFQFVFCNEKFVPSKELTDKYNLKQYQIDLIKSRKDPNIFNFLYPETIKFLNGEFKDFLRLTTL